MGLVRRAPAPMLPAAGIWGALQNRPVPDAVASGPVSPGTVVLISTVAGDQAGWAIGGRAVACSGGHRSDRTARLPVCARRYPLLLLRRLKPAVLVLMGIGTDWLVERRRLVAA